MGFPAYGKEETAGARTASGTKTARFRTLTPLRRRTLMLTAEGIEKAIQLYESLIWSRTGGFFHVLKHDAAPLGLHPAWFDHHDIDSERT